jgi:glycosyltransferase involved in cell wall biosynthesis
MAIRVLYLHEVRRMGGAERALLGLADAIRQVKVEPLMVWPQQDPAFAWLTSRGIRVIPLRVPRWRHGLSLPVFPLFLARLRRVIHPTDVDLVHVNNYRSAPIGQFVSRWAGVPCVCHVRETITAKAIRQYRLHLSNSLIAVAEAVGHALRAGGIPAGRITVVRSGVMPQDTPPEAETLALRGRLGLSPHDPVLGIVAHILPHKGFDELVEALALLSRRLPQAKCLVIGMAPRERYLRELLQRAERLSVRDRLILAGFQEDVAPFLHAMDVFVLPSRTEGLPITILEAMAAGRPVVATTAGGIPEVVRDGETGLLVPPGHPGRLAEAVLRLLEAPALAKTLGQAGRQRVTSAFTLEGETEQTAMVYRKVLAAPKSVPVRDSPG